MRIYEVVRQVPVWTIDAMYYDREFGHSYVQHTAYTEEDAQACANRLQGHGYRNITTTLGTQLVADKFVERSA